MKENLELIFFYILYKVYLFLSETIGFAQVSFPIDLQTALNCNQVRNRHVDDSVIVDMFKKLKMPSSENLWEKYTATWDHRNADSESLYVIYKVVLLSYR